MLMFIVLMCTYINVFLATLLYSPLLLLLNFKGQDSPANSFFCFVNVVGVVNVPRKGKSHKV